MKTVSKEQEKLNEMISEKLQLVNKAKELDKVLDVFKAVFIF